MKKSIAILSLFAMLGAVGASATVTVTDTDDFIITKPRQETNNLNVNNTTYYQGSDVLIIRQSSGRNAFLAGEDNENGLGAIVTGNNDLFVDDYSDVNGTAYDVATPAGGSSTEDLVVTGADDGIISMPTSTTNNENLNNNAFVSESRYAEVDQLTGENLYGAAGDNEGGAIGTGNNYADVKRTAFRSSFSLIKR